MLTLIGFVLTLGALICAVIVLFDAFRTEVWKGVAGLVCGIYLLYYGFVEFEHDYKGIIVGTLLVGGIMGRVLMAWGSMPTLPAGP